MMQSERVHDAYAMRPEAVEEPPRRLGEALRQIGPGLILAAAVVGTGELIATTQLGAKAGFALLWLVIDPTRQLVPEEAAVAERIQ